MVYSTTIVHASSIIQHNGRPRLYMYQVLYNTVEVVHIYKICRSHYELCRNRCKPGRSYVIVITTGHSCNDLCYSCCKPGRHYVVVVTTCVIVVISQEVHVVGSSYVLDVISQKVVLQGLAHHTA